MLVWLVTQFRTINHSHRHTFQLTVLLSASLFTFKIVLASLLCLWLPALFYFHLNFSKLICRFCFHLTCVIFPTNINVCYYIQHNLHGLVLGSTPHSRWPIAKPALRIWYACNRYGLMFAQYGAVMWHSSVVFLHSTGRLWPSTVQHCHP